MKTRCEVEFNMKWAEQNPALFVEGIKDFQKQYGDENWHLSIDLSLAGYMTLVANSKNCNL